MFGRIKKRCHAAFVGMGYVRAADVVNMIEKSSNSTRSLESKYNTLEHELKEAKTKHLAQLLVLQDKNANHEHMKDTIQSYINELMTEKLNDG